MNVDELVLHSLATDEHYCRIVVPYLKKEYFYEQSYKALYLICDKYFRKYNAPASPEVLRIEIDKLRDVNELLYKEISTVIDRIEQVQSTPEREWRINESEQFCQDRALQNAMEKAIQIMKGNERNLSKTAIPDLMKDAVAVEFDSKLGHDYFDDAEEAFEYYTSPENHLPFDIEVLNEITNGGVKRKTLNLLLAGTHVGKSLGLCHLAGAYLNSGYNVLYVTFEMAEEEIRRRIDANLLNIKMDDIGPMLNRDAFLKRIASIGSNCRGRLKIKEYPTSGASTSNIRHYVNELKLKQNFVPDVIIVDYLNIVASDRHKTADNSYTYKQSVAEELRGFAKEVNPNDPDVTKRGCVVWSALQLNREGLKSSDPDMTDTADSIGIAFTADFTLLLYTNPDLIRVGHLLAKQEKNRYKNLNYKKKFIVGVDYDKMRWYDVEQSVQVMPTIDDDEDETPRLRRRTANSRGVH